MWNTTQKLNESVVWKTIGIMLRPAIEENQTPSPAQSMVTSYSPLSKTQEVCLIHRKTQDETIIAEDYLPDNYLIGTCKLPGCQSAAQKKKIKSSWIQQVSLTCHNTSNKSEMINTDGAREYIKLFICRAVCYDWWLLACIYISEKLFYCIIKTENIYDHRQARTLLAFIAFFQREQAPCSVNVILHEVHNFCRISYVHAVNCASMFPHFSHSISST